MAISDDLNSIGTHLENDYKALEQLGVSVEDRNIENIKDMANQIYAKFPKTEFQEGSNITLSNTLKGKLDFEDDIVGYGDTQQTTYNGYNKINCSMATTTTSGVTATHNADGTYTINGTATADVYFDICFFELPAGTYKLVGCPNGGSWANYIQYIRRVDGQAFSINDSGNGGTGEVTGNEGQLRLSILIVNGYTANNLVFKPMVTTNTSLSYNDYEKYVGGTASPNSSYPQEIEVVRGKNRVKNTQKGYWNNDGVWQDDNTFCSSNKIEVEVGKTYVGSMFDNNKNYINKMVYVVFDKNDTFVRYSGDDTVTIASGEKYVSIRNYSAQSSYITSDNFLLQFEENITHTSYLPYNTLEVIEGGKNILPFKFNSRELNGITLTAYDDGTIKLNGTSTANSVFGGTSLPTYTFEKGTYTYSIENALVWGANISIYYGTNSVLKTLGTSTTGDFEITEDTTYQWFRLSLYIPSGQTYDNVILKPMIRNSSIIDDTYEPYQTPQTYQLSLGEYEFAKIGNYVDTIEYDVENDKVYKNEKIGKNDFNENLGYEDFSAYWGQGSFGTRLTNIGTDKIAWSKMLCKYFTAYTSSETKNLNNEMVVGASSIIFNNPNISTLSEWITWITTHHFSVFYPKSTPTLTEITDPTLKAQVKALYNSHSFNGTTIIEIDGNLPMILKIRGLKAD